MKSWLWLGALALAAGCHAHPGSGRSSVTPLAQPAVPPPRPPPSADRERWVANADADSVSVVDPATRTLTAEVPLGPTPAQDATTLRYDVGVAPRALAIGKGDAAVYVAGQRAGSVFVLDRAARAVTATIAVGAEPVSVVAAPDGSAVYAVNFQSATVSKIDPASNTVVATLAVAEHPWGASLAADGRSLYVTHLLTGAGVTVVDTATFTVRSQLALSDQPASSASKLVPNGQPRGVYAAVPRPGADELWLPHMLLATSLAQPDLDFQSTAFPTVSQLTAGGTVEGKRLLFKPLMVAGAGGSFNDSISGPHALAFTPDGATALMLDSASEDVMVFDAASGDEKLLVRPIPAALLEGIVVDHAGAHAYIDGRNTHDVVVLDITSGDEGTITVDGPAIERLAGADPMPMNLRLGQRLFYSANSSQFPITQNFWIACATCHLEGGSDAVTWKFAQGPRDTPSNAGGPINTGFLMRQALRNSMLDYDVTIRTEQGGLYHRDIASQLPDLQNLADYTNYAISFPRNPNVAADGTLTDSQARGQATFAAVCASCHPGAYYTDSGDGMGSAQAQLTIPGPVVLHDVGTCVTGGAFADQPHLDDVGGTVTRDACQFDTPTLRGVFATAPYFHDGSAATLADVVSRLPSSSGLSAGDQADLVAYLKTL